MRGNLSQAIALTLFVPVAAFASLPLIGVTLSVFGFVNASQTVLIAFFNAIAFVGGVH